MCEKRRGIWGCERVVLATEVLGSVQRCSGVAVIGRGGILVYDGRGPEMPNNVHYTSPGPTR